MYWRLTKEVVSCKDVVILMTMTTTAAAAAAVATATTTTTTPTTAQPIANKDRSSLHGTAAGVVCWLLQSLFKSE